MAEQWKTTLQKHETSITTLESRLEQVHQIIEEESQKNVEYIDEVKKSDGLSHFNHRTTQQKI